MIENSQDPLVKHLILARSAMRAKLEEESRRTYYKVISFDKFNFSTL